MVEMVELVEMVEMYLKKSAHNTETYDYSNLLMFLKNLDRIRHIMP